MKVIKEYSVERELMDENRDNASPPVVQGVVMPDLTFPGLCPYCWEPPKLVKGIDFDPSRLEIANDYFYQCKKDDWYIGCYPGTTRALNGAHDKESGYRCRSSWATES